MVEQRATIQSWPRSSRSEDLARSPPSGSTSFSPAPRRRRFPRRGERDDSCQGARFSKASESCAREQLRCPGKSSSGEWRKRSAKANDADNNTPPNQPAEEAQVHEALKLLRTAVDLFLGEGDIDGKINDCDICRCTEQLSTSLFEDTGPHPRPHVLHHPPLHQSISIKTLPTLSVAVVWQTAYSLIHNIQLLSKSRSSNNNCSQFILSIASVALDCLQSLIHNQQESQNGQSLGTKAMTDFRLCECASILLNELSWDEYSTLASMPDDEVLCKAILFSCLGKIIDISTRNGQLLPTHSKGGKGRRGLLFPMGSEKAVDIVVKQNALPFLETMLTRWENREGEDLDISYCYGAMECLYLLLRDPLWESPLEEVDQYTLTSQLSKHAASILAPLIIDVSSDGKENQRANPLRSRTLKAVNSFWGWSFDLVQNGTGQTKISNDQEMKVVLSCQCMAAALNAVGTIRKGKAQNDLNEHSCEIDVSAVACQLQLMIQNDALGHFRRTFLNILTLLCLAYPRSSGSQWHMFLENNGGKASLLLTILDDGSLGGEHYEEDSWIVLPSAVRTTSTLISAMPLKLWISHSSTRIRGGTFSSRVRNALLNVMSCTLHMMTALKFRLSCAASPNQIILSHTSSLGAVSTQVSRLARKLCTILPFDGENSVLLQPASRLVQCAGNIYVECAQMVARKQSATGHESVQKLLLMTISNFGDVITGTLEADSSNPTTPAGKWLSEDSSRNFIDMLLTDEHWMIPSSKDRMLVLSSVAKYTPSILSQEPFNIESFCNICVGQCSSQRCEAPRIQGFKLIESFMVGRARFFAEVAPKDSAVSIVPGFCSLMRAALDDQSPAVRACAVSSFASLLKCDWVEMLFQCDESNGGRCVDWAYIDAILGLCSADKEKSANVRSSACKAIGDIGTTCICLMFVENDDCYGDGDGFEFELTCKIWEVMINALDDGSASVRGMALFALGNTALALKMHCRDKSESQLPSIKSTFPSVCSCLKDRDEKVVTNAIRSIGHIAHFVYHAEHTLETEVQSPAYLDGYASLLLDLTGKVEFVIQTSDCASVNPQELTWKQRNGAKKHAWGSCTTLGVLLSMSNLVPYISTSQLGSAISILFGCIRLSSFINEKIVLSAINALVDLPTMVWDHLCGKCDVIGRGLATCFAFLHEAEPKRNATNMKMNVEKLAFILLPLANVADFCHLFLLQEEVPFPAEYFYQWMVNHGVEGAVFEEVAAAVSSRKVERILDVSSIHMFLSRTIQQNRDQGSPCKVDAAFSPFDVSYEEGDEL